MRKVACLVLFLLAAGCEQESDLELTSRDADARWFQGQQRVWREFDRASVEASFEGTLGAYLIFDVTVVSRSESALLIEPTEFSFTLASSGDRKPAALKQSIVAADPEVQLARLDKRIAAMTNFHQFNEAMVAVIDITDAILDLAQVGSGTEAQANRDKPLDMERVNEPDQADASFQSTIADLARARAFLATRALRRTRLGPGESVSGVVALPMGPIPKLLTRTARTTSITSFREDDAFAPGDVLTLTLHSPLGARAAGMKFIVLNP